jgi:hypothetical protein
VGGRRLRRDAPPPPPAALLHPLRTIANKQGRVAGANIAGRRESFAGVVSTAVVKLFDLHVDRARLSDTEAAQAGIEVAAATIRAPLPGPLLPGMEADQGQAGGRARDGVPPGSPARRPEGVAQRIDVVAAALHSGATVDEVATRTSATPRPSPPSGTPSSSPPGRPSTSSSDCGPESRSAKWQPAPRASCHLIGLPRTSGSEATPVRAPAEPRVLDVGGRVHRSCPPAPALGAHPDRGNLRPLDHQGAEPVAAVRALQLEHRHPISLRVPCGRSRFPPPGHAVSSGRCSAAGG